MPAPRLYNTHHKDALKDAPTSAAARSMGTGSRSASTVTAIKSATGSIASNFPTWMCRR